MLNDLRQVLPPILTRNVSDTRRKVEHAPLRDRPLHERRDIRVLIPNGPQAARNVQLIQEPRNGLEQVFPNRRVRDRCDRRVCRSHPTEDGERLAVAVWRGWGGELEDGWCGQGDAVR